jgi:hypothetical protein
LDIVWGNPPQRTQRTQRRREEEKKRRREEEKKKKRSVQSVSPLLLSASFAVNLSVLN